MLRSIRNASRELVLQGSITPKKSKPPTAGDIDDLCDLFAKRVRVSPKKSASAGAEKVANVKTKTPIKVKENKVRVPSEVSSKSRTTLNATVVEPANDDVKENFIKALKAIQKPKVAKSLNLGAKTSEVTKTSAAATMTRHSSRRIV